MKAILTLFKIILVIIIICVLSLMILNYINEDFDFKFSFNDKSELIVDQTIEESIEKIVINTKSLDIKFKKSNDNTSSVKIYDYKDSDARVNVDNNILTITSDKNNNYIFSFYKKREVIITLPEKLYDLEVKTKSGDIKSNIDFNIVSIKSTSGDINLNNIKEANIDLTSGDIHIDEVDSIVIDSTSGDIEINKINEYVSIVSTSGDVDIKSLELTKNSSIKATSGDVTILASSKDVYYNASATSGDIKIKENNRHAEIELIINTKSGDIKVIN